MATVTITIPTPVITAPDYFKVRYRSLPGGTWIDLPNQDNDPFTITGIDPGNYELEARAVLAGVECPAVITPFTVAGMVECLSVTGTWVQLLPGGAAGVINVNWSGIAPTPPCGWIIEYNSSLAWGTEPPITVYISAADFPTTGPLEIPAAGGGGVAQHIRISANYCGGATMVCYDSVIQNVLPPACTGFPAYTAQLVQIDGELKIRFDVTQSTPATTAPVVNYTQVGLVAGEPADNGMVTLSITPTTITFFVTVHPYINPLRPRNPQYKVQLRDICGNTYNWDLVFDLSL